MTAWNPFVGVTAVVVTLFLGLARLSQGLVRDDAPDPDSVVDGGAAAAVDVPAETADVPGDGHDETTDTAAESLVSTTPGGSPSRTGPPSQMGSQSQTRPPSRTGPQSLSPGALLANVALTQGLFGVAVAAAALYFALPSSALGLSDTALSTGLPAVAVGIAVGIVLWLGNEAAAVVADAAGAGYDEQLRATLAPDSLGGWLLLLGATLPIIAVVEELLFRAAFIGPPAVAYGVSPWALAVVASLAFALGHGAQETTGMVVTGALGFALAAGFVLTGSLVVVVVAHYLVNALEFLVHEGLGFERPFGWLAT